MPAYIKKFENVRANISLFSDRIEVAFFRPVPNTQTIKKSRIKGVIAYGASEIGLILANNDIVDIPVSPYQKSEALFAIAELAKFI